MPRRKMPAPAPQEPTAIIEPELPVQPALPELPPHQSPDLDAMCAQLLAASHQGLETLSQLKAQLILRYDTPETLPENSIIEQVWRSMSADQRSLIS